MKPTMIRLRHPVGTSAVVSTYGARLVECVVPDIRGLLTNVVLGFADSEKYEEFTDDLIGATVGRLAGRVENSTFCREDFVVSLVRNSPPHHLHGGGALALDRVNWEIHEQAESEVTLTTLSVDGENGYPGNLRVHARYSLTTDMGLEVEYSATSDQKTPINLTHHSYWNLSGSQREDLSRHSLRIYSTEVLETKDLIPTGNVNSTTGSKLDYSNLTSFMHRPWKELDHSFISARPGVVAELWHPNSGITLSLITDQPILQVYAGKYLSSAVGIKGSHVGAGRGLALEPQCVNKAIIGRPELQTHLLEPGVTYTNKMKFTFRYNTEFGEPNT